MGFDVKVLGQLEFCVDGVPIAPSAAKPRQLLAVLTLNAGRAMPVSLLVAELWNQAPPQSAVGTLQTYIGKLRKSLKFALADHSQDRADEVLVREPSGYRLVLPPGSIDTEVYEKHARIGRHAAETGDYPTAVASLDEALSLWRGDALADVSAGPLLLADIVKLEETRISDLDLRIGSALRLGRHHQLVGELAGLCARYPASETFCAKYMLALYRSGQQGRALEVYHRLRTSMVSEFGIDPPVSIQRLHMALLRGEPGIADPYTDARLAAGSVAS